MEQKFYICEICGNITAMITNSGVPVVCCGRKMTKMVPAADEAGNEKHSPVWRLEDGKVRITVGAAAHPMTPEHSIAWIAVSTRQGFQYRQLNVSEPPAACFAVDEEDEVTAVYAYCNLHGLWKA